MLHSCSRRNGQDLLLSVIMVVYIFFPVKFEWGVSCQNLISIVSRKHKYPQTHLCFVLAKGELEHFTIQVWVEEKTDSIVSLKDFSEVARESF